MTGGIRRWEPRRLRFRLLSAAQLVTTARTSWPAPGPLLLQSRHGSLMQSRFPDLVRAAADLPDGGLVLDGELVVWAGGRMSFEALQRRAVSGGRTAARLAQERPAHYIVFDLLQLDGQELLHVPYGERRARLERLFTDRGLTAPWTLCPETTDPAMATEWLTSWTQVPGVEGLVIRGSGQQMCQAPVRSTRCAAGTPPRRSSALSPVLCAGRRRLCWAASTRRACSGRSAAVRR
ncbi:hypothetical protein TU94_00135 [Streptomyces cyaneogriseus subsp. noncyanogenus]|uniref:ATP-dependent DNA ligase family profile domain-containing protein n=1 Tax=Streptomyces cyaneogriseus subsp. noncyanogenus TaxID=477245 RepID=A0A0C5FWQ9_9ACTN|nr:hypothetical protein TU94_00135 [Streptomyces cyaneogriseus subsp. noncyanogenus]